MPSYERDLERGIMRFMAEHIDGVGNDLDVPWEEQDALPLWPTFPRVEPTPHRLIAVVVGAPTFERADIDTLVQLRIRGDQDAGEDEVLDMGQDIFDLFYPRGFPRVHFTLPQGPRIGASMPISRARLGADSQRRHELSYNFRFRGRRVTGA